MLNLIDNKWEASLGFINLYVTGKKNQPTGKVYMHYDKQKFNFHLVSILFIEWLNKL